MNLHSGARTCPASRALLVERILQLGWSVSRAAESAGISRQTAYKWLSRHSREGHPGLRDRASRPHRSPTALPLEDVGVILVLRQGRMTGARISQTLGTPKSTVARVLKKHRLSRARDLDPRQPARRYNRRHPGELLHLDVKKLGRIQGVYGHRVTGDRSRRVRGAGWEYVHIAIDDASRLAYAEVLADERGDTSAAFLDRAIAWFKRLGIRIRQILTDNGSGYVSICFRLACGQLQVQHLRTRPYRPCTNGKAERFIQTLIREWAYTRPYRSSKLRTKTLSGYLRFYNTQRPHGSLEGNTPSSRIGT